MRRADGSAMVYGRSGQGWCTVDDSTHDGPQDDPRRPPSVWRTVGIVLAVTAGVAGLALVAFAIVVVVSLNSWASNK